jgi:hypothetical protein
MHFSTTPLAQAISIPRLGTRQAFSRRQFLAVAAGTLSAATLAGCSSPSQSAKAAKAVTASYRTRPELKAPLIKVAGPTGVPAAGYLFVTPGGPLIVDNVGEPVWIHPVPHASTNLRVQRDRGQPVLTWWQGEVAPYGVSQEGEYVVMDSSYRQIMAVSRDGMGHLTVYASWNGSTETASWQALAGGSPSDLASVAAAPQTGFETSIRVVGSASYVAARALDASGAVLATSPSVKV